MYHGVNVWYWTIGRVVDIFLESQHLSAESFYSLEYIHIYHLCIQVLNTDYGRICTPLTRHLSYKKHLLVTRIELYKAPIQQWPNSYKLYLDLYPLSASISLQVKHCFYKVSTLQSMHPNHVTTTWQFLHGYLLPSWHHMIPTWQMCCHMVATWYPHSVPTAC